MAEFVWQHRIEGSSSLAQTTDAKDSLEISKSVTNCLQTYACLF